jgi:polyisoprenoid-binding protein YceI
MNASVIKSITLASLVLAVAQWARAEPVTYALSGQVSYEGSSPMGIWHGTNSTMSGNLVWDKQTGSATGTVCVTVGSWITGNSVRDGHSKTMFEADRFPKACFTFMRIENKKLTGTLDLHGVKLPLEIPGKLREDRGRLQFSADMVMKLNDWKLVRPSLLGAEVANEVEVHIHGEGTAK